MSKSKNSNMTAAKLAKNDQFYTQLTDIEKELEHYKDQFKGKVVLCNCDDPKESKFVDYFMRNFKRLGLKKLMATHFMNSDLFVQEPAYRLEYTGGDSDCVDGPAKYSTQSLSPPVYSNL